MRKDLLITLLTATATGTAFANVNVTDQIGDWSFAGVPGTGSEIGKLDLLVPNYAGGVASQTITGLPQGKYILSWTSAENVEVKANGTVVTNGEAFDLAAGQNLVITIGPDDATANLGGYNISGISLQIVCNPADFRAQLLAAIAEAGDSFTELNENVKEAVVAEFTTRKEAIEAELETLQDQAEELPNSNDVDLDVYKENSLWDLTDKNPLYTAEPGGLNAINDEITTYNGDAELANAIADFAKKAADAADSAAAAVENVPTATLNAALESATENAQSEWLTEQITEQYQGVVAQQEELPSIIDALRATNCDNAATLEQVAEADAALDDQIAEVGDTIDAYSADVNALIAALNAAINIADNYNAIYVNDGTADVPSVNYVTAAVDKARKQLFQLGGVYVPIQQQANEKINTIYDTLLAALDVKNGEVETGTDVNFNHDQVLLKQALIDIQAEVDNALDTMDGPYGVVADKIEALTESIESTEGTRPSDASDLAAEKAVIEGKISALQTAAEEALADGSIADDTFDSEIADITTLIDAYNTNVANSKADKAQYEANNDLLTGYLDDLVSVWNGWIAAEDEVAGQEHPDWRITNNTQFLASYNSIKELIQDQIDENNRIYNETTDDIEPISGDVNDTLDASVNGFTATGNSIINEILKVAGDITTYGGYADAIQSVLKLKTAYVQEVWEGYNTALGKIKTTLEKMDSDLSNAVSTQDSGQKIYEAVKDVSVKYAGVDFNADLNDVLSGIEKGISNSNQEYIVNALIAATDALPAGAVPGKSAIETLIRDLQTEVSVIDIPTDDAVITADEDIDTYAGKFADADAAIDAAYKTLETIEEAVAACNTNVDNYNANINAIANLQTELNNLDTDVKEYDAYADAYTDLIAEQQKAINGLTDSNDEGYNAFEVTKIVDEDGVVTITIGEPVATDIVDAVEQSIAETRVKINANEEYYQTLVNLSVDLSLKLSGYVDVINAHIEDGSVDAPNLAKQMSGILNQLYNYNGTIYAAYIDMFQTEGFSYDEVLGKINGWANDAEAIMASLNNDVINYNDLLFAGAWENNTENGYKAVYDTYLATVRDFDEYKVVNNAGFLAYEYTAGMTVADLLDETHASLFAYFDLIRQLNQDAIDLKNKLNGTYVEADGDNYAHVGMTITDQFDLGTPVVTDENTGKTVSGFLTLATQYNDQIEQALTNFATQINAAAEAYYAQLVADKEDLLNTAQSTMEDAGIETEVATAALVTLQGYYNAAVDAYDTAKLAEKPELAKSMDKICNELDKINDASITAATEPAARTEWEKAYAAAEEEATVDFSGCDIDDDMSYYNQLLKQLGVINDKAQEYANNNELLANLKDLKTRLDNAAAAAKAEGERLVAAWNAEHANQVLYDEFMGSGVENLDDMYKQLSNFVLQLASAPDEIKELSNIKALIDKLENDVKNAGVVGVMGVLGNVEKYNESSRYVNIVNAIDAEYVQAYNNNIDFLQSNVDAVKAGFNSALADGKITQDQANAYWDLINDLSVEINGLQDVATAEEAQEGIDNVNKLQGELARYQVILDTALGLDPIGDVEKALKEASGNVANELAQLQGVLDSCLESVQGEYASQIEAIQAEIEAVNAKIVAEPEIIYQQANIEDQFNRISQEISNLETAIKSAEDAAQAQIALETENQQIYDQFKPEVESIGTATELLQNESEFFDYSAQNTIDNAVYYKDWLNGQLTNAYDNTALPSWPEWYKDDFKWYVTWQCNNVNSTRVNRAYDQTRNIYNSANSWVNYVADCVLYFDLNHPSQAGRFEGDLAEIVTALATLDAVQSFTGDTNPYSTEEVTAYVDGLKTIYEQAQAIIVDSRALLDLIYLNDVVSGDVNGDGNVTVADVAKLLSWILDNTQFDDGNRNHIAADINGNHRLDTSDIQSILNIIFGSQAKAVAMQRIAPAQANITVASERVAIADGAQRFAINMANDTQLVGGMVDLVPAEGMEITSIMPTERLEGLEFYTNDLGNGVTRVVFICTTETRTISGTDGALFNVEVTGTGSISLDNVEFTNAKAHLYTIGAVSTPSGIESIWSDVKAFGRKIYNVSGQMMNRLQRGINIVINSDGTSSKVIKK